MGKKRIRFRCHRCLHCCTDVVCLPTPRDVIEIVKATGARPADFLEFLTPGEIDEVGRNDPTWLKCNGARYIMALRRDPKRGCHFVDRETGHCLIYAARPMLCRLFPFRLHETRSGEFNAFSLHRDVECPRRRDGTVETGILYAVFLEDATHQEDYRALVRVFNGKQYSEKKPEDFIVMFYQEIRQIDGGAKISR